MTSAEPRVDYVHCLLSVLDRHTNQVLNKYLPLLLSDVELLAFSAKQVDELLLVYFEERDLHLPLRDRLPLLLRPQLVENMLQRVHDDARAFIVDLLKHTHGVGLASAGLPVDEEGPVEAINHVVNQRQGAVLEDFVLGAFLIEDAAEFELPGLFGLLNVQRNPLWELSVAHLLQADAPEVLLGRPAVLRGTGGEDVGEVFVLGAAEAQGGLVVPDLPGECGPHSGENLHPLLGLLQLLATAAGGGP